MFSLISRKTLEKNSQKIPFASGATVAELPFAEYYSFAMIIPSQMNSLTATFQVWDEVAQAWVSTGVTQVLATGFWSPSAAQLQALQSLDRLQISLSAGVGSACILQFFAKG